MVYDELRRLAAAHLAGESPGLTLQPTALVHEAYVRLLGSRPHDSPQTRWDGRAHFFGAAARAMRQILVDRARRIAAEKHGGGRARVPLVDATAIMSDPTPSPEAAATAGVDLVALNEALSELESGSPRPAEVVILRYFGGLSVEETAAALDISPATVKSDWSFAKAWLRSRLSAAVGTEPAS